MFKSKKEFAAALMEGRRFKYGGTEMFFEENRSDGPFMVKFTSGRICGMRSYWNYYNRVTEIKPWYENIPEKGVLCWVRDNKSQADRVPMLVVGMDGDPDYPFITKGESFRYATPMTKEEVMEYILCDQKLNT